MAITYHSGRRLQGLSTDMSSNIVTINHRLSSTDDHAYADLGSALSNSSWVMRYKMVISGYSASSSNPNNSYLFTIAKTNTAEQDTQSLGLKLQIGGVGGSVAKVSGNTSSQSSGEGYGGGDFTTTVANATWYIEYIRNGADFSVRITTNSDYTGGENKTWSTSGTVEDLRYIKYTNRDDSSSSWVLVSTISDIKIYDGVTSATGTFVRDGTWTASSSNKVTVATQDSKPTDVQVGSRLEETDTRKMYNYVVSSITFEDDFSSDNWTDNDSTNMGVSGGTFNWNCKRDGSNDASTYDLTSTSANWVLRFKLKVTNVSSSTQAGNGFFVGLSDSNQTVDHGTSQDFIGVSIYNDNTDSYRAIDADGTAIPDVYSGDSSQTTTYNTGSIWYYEIIKTGSSYTIEAFSGSDYSTGSEGKITGSSNASGLQYIKIINDDMSIPTSTNPFQGTIDDVKFYDGVTQTTNYWQEIGT